MHQPHWCTMSLVPYLSEPSASLGILHIPFPLLHPEKSSLVGMTRAPAMEIAQGSGSILSPALQGFLPAVGTGVGGGTSRSVSTLRGYPCFHFIFLHLGSSVANRIPGSLCCAARDSLFPLGARAPFLSSEINTLPRHPLLKL